jgi:hypothetical protein
MRAQHERFLPLRVDIWRSPAAVGGKTGAPVKVKSSIPANIVPADLDGENTTAPLGLSGDRGDHVGYLRYGTDVRPADELRYGAHRFKVESVAANLTDDQISAWSTCVVVALSKVGT